jgi:hypothetical protein
MMAQNTKKYEKHFSKDISCRHERSLGFWHRSYLYGNLSTRFGLAGRSVRFVCGVNPTFVNSLNSIDETITLVFRHVVGLLNVIVGAI